MLKEYLKKVIEEGNECQRIWDEYVRDRERRNTKLDILRKQIYLFKSRLKIYVPTRRSNNIGE